MDNLARALQERAAKQSGLNVTLSDIFIQHFKLRDEDKQDAPYMAYGMMAVDTAVTLANMFINVKLDRGALNIVRDLTFTLNANKFWNNASTIIIPLMQAATNAQTDSLLLQGDRLANDNYQNDDNLIISARAMPLEIFPMIAFMLGGPQLMQECSLPLKRDLSPYFLS